MTTRPVVLVSRHDFITPLTFYLPRSKDPILQTANGILRRFNQATLSRFQNPLELEPLFEMWESASELRVPKHRVSSVEMFAIGRVGMMATVPLYMDNYWGVRVKLDGLSMTLSAWLESLDEPSCDILGQRGYEAQLAWYKATRTTAIPIMTLPPEIRIKIMMHTLGRG